MSHEQQHDGPELARRLTLGKDETALALGISPRQVDEMIADGSLPVVRIGRRVLVPVDGLRAWIAARTVGGSAPTRPEGGAA